MTRDNVSRLRDVEEKERMNERTDRKRSQRKNTSQEDCTQKQRDEIGKIGQSKDSG